jgi:hypothetical protein
LYGLSALSHARIASSPGYEKVSKPRCGPLETFAAIAADAVSTASLIDGARSADQFAMITPAESSANIDFGSIFGTRPPDTCSRDSAKPNRDLFVIPSAGGSFP